MCPLSATQQGCGVQDRNSQGKTEDQSSLGLGGEFLGESLPCEQPHAANSR